MRWGFLLLALVSFVQAVPARAVSVYVPQRVREYVEDEKVNPDLKKDRNYQEYLKFKAKMVKPELYGSLKDTFKTFSERIEVPGFMSSAPIPKYAKIVGPSDYQQNFRIGDTVYLHWMGTPGARAGDRFNTYTPAIVLQSISDPTDFIVRLPLAEGQELPAHYRMAGYCYESTGTLRITKVSQGIVDAVLEDVKGQITIGDEIMPALPVYPTIKPITGGIQLAAALVSGSPPDRLSTLKRTFIYINRGAKDGIKVGRVFQAVETVSLQGVVAASPEVSVGEAMVVYVSDAYSTAIITKQFDVIRIGSLLKTKQEFTVYPPKVPFGQDKVSAPAVPNPELEVQVPEETMEKKAEAAQGPAPGKMEAKPLSELDELESKKQVNALSPAEKLRLEKLNKQESKIGTALPVVSDELQGIEAPFAPEKTEEGANAVPELPTVENSFSKEKGQAEKEKSKKSAKKKKKTTDEEELNLLMMQN